MRTGATKNKPAARIGAGTLASIMALSGSAAGASPGDQIVMIGGQVKSLGAGKYRAPIVTFGNQNAADLTGEYFTAQTNFWKSFPCEVPVLYSHGMDATLGLKTIGNNGTATLSIDAAGVWMEGQLNLSDAYEAKISSMIDAGKMYTSSGSAPHMVTKVLSENGTAYEIKSWPLVEASLTPTPAEYRNKVMPLKSLKASLLGTFGSYDYGYSWFDPDDDAIDPVEELTCAAAETLNYRLRRAVDNILTAAGLDKAAKLAALRGVSTEFADLLVNIATALLTDDDDAAVDTADVLKSLLGAHSRPDSIKSFEKLLRDSGGFSRKEATVIASGSGIKSILSDSAIGQGASTPVIDAATRKQIEFDLMQLETLALANSGHDASGDNE